LRADQGELCAGTARKQLTREQTSHVQRLQKTLEEANIKLDSVITDVLGMSGRRMIAAMIAGVTNPFQLAALADRRIKACPGEGRGPRPRHCPMRCMGG